MNLEHLIAGAPTTHHDSQVRSPRAMNGGASAGSYADSIAVTVIF